MEITPKIDILLVEDNPADIRLMMEILKEGNIPHNFHVVTDGEEAISFVRQEGHFSKKPRPGIIFLDLNLPKKDGREVLKEIKGDVDLQPIPVVIMSTSEAEEDIKGAYRNSANCFITKPVDLNQFEDVVNIIHSFWLSIVKLPKD